MTERGLAPAQTRGPTDESTKSSPESRLAEVLWRIAREIEGVQGVAVADPQGLPVASLIRGRTAMAATAMATLARSAAESVTANLGLSSAEDIIIETRDSTILVRCLGRGYTLLAVFSKETNLGFVKIELERYGADLEGVLDLLR